MDDNFSNFPEIIVQKLNSIFSKFQFYFFTKGQKFFLQVSYENRNRSLFLLVTFLKMKVFYKLDKKRKCTFGNMSTVIDIEFYDHWLAYRHCFVIDAKIRRVTQGALLRIPADSPDSDLLTSARNKTLLREKCVLHPGMTGWESWEKDLNKKG